MAEILPYYLGLPAWAYARWQGPYFPADRPALESYSQVFSAVEGNTTFYAIPDDRTVAGWREKVAGRRFRFCFKLPRSVTHEPRPGYADLRLFFDRLEPLDGSLGPFLVQLPASFGPESLGELERLAERLPRRHRYVVELRHPAFFDAPERLEPLLDEFGFGRVMLDSRPIYEGDRQHPEVLDALHEKPDVPVLDTVYGGIAFIRLILHPETASNDPWLDEWAARCAAYLAAGYETFMMIHCPNNQHCPALAESFHGRLRRRLEPERLPSLPAWPVPQQATLL